MVTHRRANLIMLISNLPSVRSSRFKPNVGSRMILRLSLSFERIFLFRSSVTLCPSPFCQIRDRRPCVCVCVCMYSHQDDDDGDEHLFLHIFFFRFCISTFDSLRSPSGERRRRIKFIRVAPLPYWQLNSCIHILSLHSSLQ